MKPSVILLFAILLAIATQARHVSVDGKAMRVGTKSTSVAKKPAKVSAGHDLSPVHFLVLDI
ncbi:MAG: hypothetical protein NVV59_13620 [Chitinophagaceae bacterium]|nr:hypothetical protein [Chitinophagaceae bacterium]